MSQKYKIMSNLKELSDSEINSYKDFDGLLAMHKKTSKQWKTKAIVFSIILVATIASIGYLYLPNTSILDWKNSSKPAISGHSKPITDSSLLSEIRDIPPKDIDNGKDIPSRNNTPQPEKNEVDKSNLPLPTKPAEEVKSTVQSGFEEAQPAGGYPALFEFFKQKVQYPEQSKKQKIEGAVLVEFYVNEKGKPVDITILKGINPELDNEALRLINSMPAWQPALVEGKPVSMKLTLPLNFQIQPAIK